MRLLALLPVLLFVFPALAEKRKVTFNIYMDLSDSMAVHRSKVADIAGVITRRLHDECEDYMVSVNNILYTDYQPRKNEDAFAIFQGPHYITPENDQGADYIRKRIEAPLDNLAKSYGKIRIPKGNREVTYGSVVESIKRDASLLQSQDMVAALLVTDATPDFDSGNPEAAVRDVWRSLGGVPFVAGVITVAKSNPFFQTPAGDFPIGCHPDFGEAFQPTYGGGVGFVEANWQSSGYQDLVNFAEYSGGSAWDVCSPNYNYRLNEFIDSIITQASCQLIM